MAEHSPLRVATPSREAPSTPLFGLRWVPDGALRPLRYLPNPNTGGAGGEERRRRRTEDDEEEEGVGESPARTPQLQQSVRALTERLDEANESVRQKSEQIRWLKEMTKDEARRSRVARWLRGPLLRVFTAWKRCVREAMQRALRELQRESDARAARQRELQAASDEMSREHAVLQCALGSYFAAAQRARTGARLAEAFRRWAPLRRRVVAAGAAARRAAAAAAAAAAYPHGQLATHSERSAILRRGTGAARPRAAPHDGASAGAAAVAISVRSALRRMRSECGRRAGAERLGAALGSSACRRTARRAWCRWLAAAVRGAGARRAAEASRAERMAAELQQRQTRVAAAELETKQLRAINALWGDDELPAMVAALSAAAEAAEAAAGDAGPDGDTARRAAAVAASGWQGTQLRLTVAVLDSLKREMARERAALASARAEAKRSDETTERALQMLEQVRDEGSAMTSRLATLEEAKLRAEQALCRRDAELHSYRRAQHAAARTLGRAVSQAEERSVVQLQRIEAALDVRGSQLAVLQMRMARATEAARASKLDQWVKDLERPPEELA